MRGRVLIVAGSDSGGGAGIQADIKTVTALRGYAATAVTALTAQNTLGVFGVVGVAPAFIQQQMRVVLDDLGADAVKTGMLHAAEVIEAVCEVLEGLDPPLPLVADPVMVAQSGDPLVDPGAVSTLAERLVPLAAVLTPNVPEAARLAGLEIAGPDDLARAAERLLGLGPRAVLLKGGHLAGDTVRDVLATRDGLEVFESPRLDTRHTHGTGCTLASAIAAGLGWGLDLTAAIGAAKRYVSGGMRYASPIGQGPGPLEHFWIGVPPRRPRGEDGG